MGDSISKGFLSNRHCSSPLQRVQKGGPPLLSPIVSKLDNVCNPSIVQDLSFSTQLITMAKALVAVALLALLACALAQKQNADDARELVGASSH